ncbi:MAG: hypothetical protein KDE53_09520 [Caldilineaceae bacterium]|nr:hypothetical protein [Caldilineaceae bacterium]
MNNNRAFIILFLLMHFGVNPWTESSRAFLAAAVQLSAYWTLANFCSAGVIIGRQSSVITRVLTEKRQIPVLLSAQIYQDETLGWNYLFT